jgi:hypothetical protein
LSSLLDPQISNNDSDTKMSFVSDMLKDINNASLINTNPETNQDLFKDVAIEIIKKFPK